VNLSPQNHEQLSQLHVTVIKHTGYTLKINNENCHPNTVMCRETARHERMTDSRSRQPTKVTATSEADGVADTDSGQDQLPTDDPITLDTTTRHTPKRHHETCACTNSSLQDGHQSQTRTTRKHPDVTQTPHTEFHHSHGIRQHTWSPAIRGSSNSNTEYAEICRDVESADTHSNTASTTKTQRYALALCQNNTGVMANTQRNCKTLHICIQLCSTQEI